MHKVKIELSDWLHNGLKYHIELTTINSTILVFMELKDKHLFRKRHKIGQMKNILHLCLPNLSCLIKYQNWLILIKN